MDLRVAPRLASFSVTVDETPGCPDSPRCAVSPPMSLQVTPAAASSDCSGDGVSSHLESRILRRYLAAAFRVAPGYRFVSAASRPEASGFPVTSSLPAAGDGSSSLPEFASFWRYRRLTLRVAPSRLPVSPIDAVPGFPRLLHLPAASWVIGGLPRFFVPLTPPTGGVPGRPASLPFGLPAAEGPSRPVSSLPPALPLPRLRVSPGPASTAGR